MNNEPTSPTTTTPTITTTPTTADIQKLADAIARGGIDAHRQDLAAIAQVAADTGLYPAAVDVLQTASTPDAARARAFLVLARHWPEIAATAAASSQQERAFDRAFRTLACRWERHRTLRRSGTPAIDELWRSRTNLEAARAEMQLLRAPR